MAQYSAIRAGRHVVFDMHVHLAFVTKRRRHVLDADAQDKLQSYFRKVCRDFEAALAECKGADDHVHLLVTYGPKTSVSSLVNSLKGVSSRLLQRDRPDLTLRLKGGALWSPTYFAVSCGGAPLSSIKAYIEQQQGA